MAQDLDELVTHPLGRGPAQSRTRVRGLSPRLRLEREARELRQEARRSQGAQGILADHAGPRQAQPSRTQVGQSSQRVEDTAGLQIESDRVDREIATAKIV